MADQGNKSKCKGLKICCAASAILILIFALICVVLFLTVFKPKQPTITTRSVELEYMRWVPATMHLNVTLGITVTINNPNYGSLKYGNSTAIVTYRGTVAAEAPIEAVSIPAWTKHDVSTTVVIIAEKLQPNPYFLLDFAEGWLNFTSSTTLHGKASMFKIFKVKATTYTTCDISVQYTVQNVVSICHSKVKY